MNCHLDIQKYNLLSVVLFDYVQLEREALTEDDKLRICLCFRLLYTG